jgi:hypothetical protein
MTTIRLHRVAGVKPTVYVADHNGHHFEIRQRVLAVDWPNPRVIGYDVVCDDVIVRRPGTLAEARATVDATAARLQ